ncbi:MAG: tripartite tricarboxylate transporter TctB family protein [Beijerinckiaceae bacterium]
MEYKRQRLTGERGFVIFLLIFSLVMLWSAYRISGFSSISSAGAYPMAATFAMVVSALVILRNTHKLRASERKPSESKAQQFRREITPTIVLTFSISVILYMLALERFGFVLSSFVYLMTAMWLLGSRNVGRNIWVSILAIVSIYIVFQSAFSVVLPQGDLLKSWVRGTSVERWLP